MARRIKVGNRFDARALRDAIFQRYGFYTYWSEETRRCTRCGSFSNAPQTACDHTGPAWERHPGRVFAVHEASGQPLSGPGKCIYIGTAFEIYREFIEKDGTYWKMTREIAAIRQYEKIIGYLPPEAQERLCGIIDDRRERFPERLLSAIFGCVA